MKISKHIVFRLLFFLAVIFSLGLEVYTSYHTPVCNTELASSMNGEENNVFSNMDSIEDDHTYQGLQIIYFEEKLILIPISNKSFLRKEIPFSSWEPPRFS